MTVTDQDTTADEDLHELAGQASGQRLGSAEWSLSWPMRVLLASLSFGAACIHLAMVPAHAGEWLAEGVAFALAGWLQLALAVAFLARPTKPTVVVSIVANVVFMAAWVWTRTAGAPFGPEAGVAHGAGFVDITCVALEAAVVAVGLLALARPATGQRLERSWVVPLSLVPVGVLVLATVAIVSPSATEHGHADGVAAGTADHDHGAPSVVAAPMDHSHLDPAAPMDHSHTTGTAASTASDHDHGTAATAPTDDKGLALLSNGEMAHAYGPDQPLDEATRAQLVHQLALTPPARGSLPDARGRQGCGERSSGWVRARPRHPHVDATRPDRGAAQLHHWCSPRPGPADRRADPAPHQPDVLGHEG